MHYFRILLMVAVLSLSCACIMETSGTASEEIHNIVEDYEDYEAFDKKAYPLGLFTRKRYQKDAEFARQKLDQLENIVIADLNDTDRISTTLLKFILQEQIDFYDYEGFLNPLLSDSGFQSDLPYIVRPLTDAGQAKEYLNKLNAIPVFVDQHIANLREGIKKGRTQPKVIFNGYEGSYNDHIVSDYKTSYFYSPFNELPETITGVVKDSILKAAQIAVEEHVIAEFKRIRDFFETEYLPNARTTLGISETHGGSAYYQNRINYYTTSSKYTAASIHEIGLKEVARIHAKMDSIIRELDYSGNFSDFLKFLRTDSRFYASAPEELLRYARDIAKRSDAQLPRFFHTLPRKPYGVAPVPASIAPKYTGGRYVGTEAESTDPGYYWVNTYDLPSRPLYTLPALTVHEAVPGHHLQGALNLELGDSIPQFRKDLYISAFGEGWGLYTEFLADEMGIYTTPYEYFGQLTYEMWRACRLVVDTGIHAKGWTREQVVDYMAENTALSLHEINTETDRYISWPGQALSYKIGELKIRELRKRAEHRLGSRFNIRDFHETVLEQGTVTLAILEERVDAYIDRVSHGE